MRVEPSQLVPGCVVLRDVTGKTNKPIVPERTVLTQEHITILHKFLVETVDVAATLADGEPFQPDLISRKDVEQSGVDPCFQSFEAQYKTVVENYKVLFSSWQKNAAVSIPTIRDMFIPLVEQMDDIDSSVYKLHHYATSDDYIYHHSVSVGLLAAFVAKKIGYDKTEWLQVGLAGLLSDCGMARLDEAIVKKRDALTPREQQEINKHPIYSYRMLEKMPAVTQAVKLAVLQHHERLDGSGYPLGVSKQKTHIYARIIAVCDIYHAMSCDRLYQGKEMSLDIIKELKKNQFIKLDHQVTDVLIDSLIQFVTGRRARLSSNQTAEIVFIDKNYPSLPIVKLDDSQQVVSLMENNSLSVETIF